MLIKIETRGLKHDGTVTKFTVRLGSAAETEEFTAIEAVVDRVQDLLWEQEQELQLHITARREEALEKIATLQDALVQVRNS